MSTELAIKDDRAAIAINDQGVNLRSFDEMGRFSQAILASGLAPKDFKTPEAVMVAIQTGMEIGLKPMQALQGICVINGRPTIWGDAALAIVRVHPEFSGIEETFERGKTDDEMMAVCVIERAGQIPVRRTFSVADAKRAGLWAKAGPWKQYPKRMLQMRARAFAMRDAFPDALKGCGVREEVGDYKEAKAREVKPAVDLILPTDEEPAPESAENQPDPETGEFPI